MSNAKEVSRATRTLMDRLVRAQGSYLLFPLQWLPGQRGRTTESIQGDMAALVNLCNALRGTPITQFVATGAAGKLEQRKQQHKATGNDFLLAHSADAVSKVAALVASTLGKPALEAPHHQPRPQLAASSSASARAHAGAHCYVHVRAVELLE